ncbi:chloride channel protein [Sphaerochaeta sp. PS]|uniref:chloride channel protein n=1 Tax=Sphaerochaeta sp. PS TaxID=3076336 RepID=UPI0028A49180|nr:chloride channel protein [Sphaerochaeta sp. PS]MDT4762838.1 chloride channel protein [Sphaerochaeta sp. PS]
MNKENQQVWRTMYLSFLCVFVGVVAAFGSIGFRYLIDFFHNLLFMGTFSFKHNLSNSRWGNLVILVPAIGLALANYITQKWAPEAKGHGVPEVMVAVSENKGRIRPIVALVKTFASALTIGSGGSVGKEGPIVQIGSSFGSTLGQVFKLSPRETIILVGAGAAGGISATFNAPIGGVMFALELILPEYSIMTIMPLVVSSTVSTYISSLILGTGAAFIIPEYMMVSSYELLIYALLGLFAGLLSVLFIMSVYSVEDFIAKIHIPSVFKALAGGLLVGLIGLFCLKAFGSYYVYGVGYEFLNSILANKEHSLVLMLSLIVLKIFANSLTLGSGGSGGIFAPSLFLGAALGGVLGMVANLVFPGDVGPIAAYAIVGMGAMVSGVTGGVLTSIIMIFEMTRNYQIMLPLMLAVVISHFVAKLLYKETMYTKKLTRRGINIQFDKRISTFKTITVGEIMQKHIVGCLPTSTVKDVLALMHEHQLGVLPVIDGSEVLGTISYKELYKAKAKDNDPITAMIIHKPMTIPTTSNLYDALELLQEIKGDILIVMDKGAVAGLVTVKRLIYSSMDKRRLS